MTEDTIMVDVENVREFLFPVETPTSAGRPLRVYLACPLTGLDETLTNECIQVRRLVKEEFGRLTVAAFDVYDPGDHTPPGTEHSAEQVYRIDHQGTVGADLVFFCAVAPSSGMGIESQIAAEATVPRVVVYRTRDGISRMMAGGPARTIEAIEYGDLEDLRSKLRHRLQKIADRVLESAARRRTVVDAAVSARTGRFILRRRISLGVHIQVLADHMDISPAWLLQLERNPMAAACMTCFQFHRLGDSLESAVSFIGDLGVPTLIAKSEIGETLPERESLENLVDFVLQYQDDIDDVRLLDIWSDYKQQANEIDQEALAGRERMDKPVSIQEWCQRYKDKFEQLF